MRSLRERHCFRWAVLHQLGNGSLRPSIGSSLPLTVRVIS